MLNFDTDRFIRTQSAAVSLAHQIDEIVATCLERGARNLFFAGAGGAGILMQTAAQLLQTRSTFPVYTEMPAELVVRGSVHLGAHSVVVLPSLSGTTQETLDALAYSRNRGATVIALTGRKDSPLAREADHNLTNEAADDTSSESYYLQSLLLALSLMTRRGEFDRYQQVVEEFKRLPWQFVDVKRRFEDGAETLADRLQHEPWHIITGAGAAWPEAFYYGMCILEEMQWIRTRPVHASDFFHGTLELVEKDVSVMLLKGEDEARPLADRVEKFARDHTTRLEVIDAAEFPLDGVSDTVRGMVSPAVLATALERLSAHLEVKRSHPLTTRRYYRRVAY